MNSASFKYMTWVKEAQVDVLGHMNHVQYLQVLEEARWQIIDDVGFGFHYIAERKIGPAVVSIAIRFLKELRLRQSLTILTVARRKGYTQFEFSQEIFDGKGQLCCTAQVTMVLVDLVRRTSMKPPLEWIRALGLPDNDEMECL